MVFPAFASYGLLSLDNQEYCIKTVALLRRLAPFEQAPLAASNIPHPRAHTLLA